MDGHRVCLRDGFPRRFPNAGDPELSNTLRRRMADRPQTPKDVSTLGPEPYQKSYYYDPRKH
jgi:hypothetical protein